MNHATTRITSTFGWLVGWLVGWLGGWLVGWMVGWMVGWLQYDSSVNWLQLLAELNLQAGRKAKESTSHDLALKYLIKGIEVLCSDCWNLHYELAYELYLEAAKCEYLMGQYEVCEAHITTLRKHKSTNLKSAAVSCLFMQV
jgi:predicted ATPase